MLKGKVTTLEIVMLIGVVALLATNKEVRELLLGLLPPLVK